MALDWTDLESLTDDELAVLVATTVDVLKEGAEDDVDVDDLDVDALPPSVLQAELEAAFSEEGISLDDATAEEITAESGTSREVAITVLEQLADQPALREEIEDAYAERQGMMVVEGGVLIGAALLILVMKLKRVKAGEEGVDVQFHEFKGEMLKGVRDVLGI